LIEAFPKVVTVLRDGLKHLYYEQGGAKELSMTKSVLATRPYKVKKSNGDSVV
jgi:large subunit ribosomal protein L30